MRREVSGGAASLDLLGDLLNWLLRLSAVALLVITGYYIYWSWAMGQAAGHTLAPDEFARHSQNMDLLTKVLLAATILTLVGALGRYYMRPETGGVLLPVGALFFFGMPAIIQNFGIVNIQDRQVHRLADYLTGRFQLSGLVLLAVGGFFLLLHGLAYLGALKTRRPQANSEAAKTAEQVRKKQDQYLGPCWNLPFCRDTEKKLCPVRQTKKPCWRTGRGCYCDQNIILQLSGGNQYQASRGGLGYLSRGAAQISRPKSLREKREQCMQCPVYLHHQSQKYWLVTPLALTILIAAVALNWEPIKSFYPQAVTALGKAMAGLSVGPSQNGVPAWATDMASQTWMVWLVVIVILMLAVSYLLSVMEWLLYRLGI